MFNSDWYPAFQESDNVFERYGERAMFATWCGERIPRDEWLPPPKQSRAEAERFLAALDPTATSFSFQVFDDNPDRKNKKLAGTFHGSLDKYWPELVRRNNNRVGIYVTISETDGKGRKAKNVERVRALFADLDGAPLEPVMCSDPRPHLVVESSPGKFHVYWIIGGIKLEQFESMQLALAERFNGDRAVKDLSRVLRLPGFFHAKGERFLSRIISAQPHIPPYTAEDFAAAKVSKNSDSCSVCPKDTVVQNSDSGPVSPRANVVNFFTAYGEQHHHEPIDVEQKLGDMEFHGLDGNGIDDTETSVSAALLNRYRPVDEAVIERVVEEILEGVRATPGTEGFDWKREATHVREKCLSWIEKHPEIADPAWLKQKYPKLAKQAEAEQKSKLPELEFYHLGELRQHPLVGRKWVCKEFILAGQLNGMFGDGGVGKDLLLLQLAMAMTSGVQWLGRDVAQGRVLYFPTEDDLDELRRRENDITEFYQTWETYRSAPEQLRIAPMVGKNAVIAVFDSRSGLVKEMPLYVSICNMIEAFKPDLVIMPNRVNMFSVGQNDDGQARQCMNLLQRICVAYKTTVIMPGHVSLSQQHTGEGTSGSVQWSNACRLRTYLHRVYDADDKDTPEPDPNLRVLEVRKANWSAIGASISMSWHEGVFKPDMIEIEQQQKQPAEVLAADAEEVLRLLDGLLKGEHVSPNVNAPNNITATFRKRSRRFKAQPERLKAALDHLYDSGVIDNVEEGPPSKKREHVIRVKR